MKIIEPTLLLDKQRCLANIARMAKKVRQNGIKFRPHCKTHQSFAIASWLRDAGAESITVSSLTMATKFVKAGWQDITVAFPVNILEIDRINDLANTIQLNVLVLAVDTVRELSKLLTGAVQVYIKIDCGYHRSGISARNTDEIDAILKIIDQSCQMSFKGFLIHAGHSYQMRNHEEILIVHNESMALLTELKMRYFSRYPHLSLSCGDTPTCSVAGDFSKVSEIRPGNFVFYDLAQRQISACREEDIAVCMACPIVAVYPERQEIVIYGGSIHFSKDALELDGDRCYGYVVDLLPRGWGTINPNRFVKSLSQEHGILKVTEQDLAKYRIGDVIGILPVHSCLTSDVMKSYTTLDGEIIPHY